MNRIRAVTARLKDYWLLTGMAVFFALSYFLIHHFQSYTVFPVETEPLQNTFEPASVRELSEEQSLSVTGKTDELPLITDTRTVKEYKGILGVYDCFGNLLESFDADVSALPFKDRQLLQEGVIFDSEGEMRNFLETLDS